MQNDPPLLIKHQKERGCVKSGRSDVNKLGLSRKANKCNDPGTGDLGVQPTHETSSCLGKVSEKGGTIPNLIGV